MTLSEILFNLFHKIGFAGLPAIKITCINAVFVEWDDKKYRINFDYEHV